MDNYQGFLAQPRSGFFDPNRVPTLGGTIIDQRPKEELRIPNISQAAKSSISPDIVESRDLALDAYQKTLLMTAPYGSKAAGINKWYESQKDSFSKEYDDAYAQAMQKQIQSVIDREKPQTEQEFNRLMLQGGLSLEDYETYGKVLWSLNDPGSQSYEVGTLFNEEGDPRNFSTREQEIAARRDGFNLNAPPQLGAPKTLYNHNTNQSVVVTDREQEAAAMRLGFNQNNPIKEPDVNASLATSALFTPESRKLYRDTGDASVLEELPEKIATLSTKEKFEQEKALRTEFETRSKEFKGLTDAFGRILVGANDQSGLGDMTIIFNYMKMLDPTSTVREGEYAAAEDTQGLPEWLNVMYKKSVDVLRGEGSRAEVFGQVGRERFVSMTEQLFREKFAIYQRRADHMTKLADNYGLDVGNIVLEYAPVILDEGGNPEFIQIGTRTIPYDPDVLPNAIGSRTDGLTDEERAELEGYEELEKQSQ